MCVRGMYKYDFMSVRNVDGHSISRVRIVSQSARKIPLEGKNEAII